MSIDFEPDPNFITDPVLERKMVVENAVKNAEAHVAKMMVVYYGVEAMIDPENKEAIRANFKSARNKAFQKIGVLDKDFQIVPGQEMFLC